MLTEGMSLQKQGFRGEAPKFKRAEPRADVGEVFHSHLYLPSDCSSYTVQANDVFGVEINRRSGGVYVSIDLEPDIARLLAAELLAAAEARESMEASK